MEQPRSCTIQVDGDAIDTAQDLEAADARLAEQQRKNEMYLARLNEKQLQELKRDLERRSTPPPAEKAKTFAMRAIWLISRLRTAASSTRARPRGAGRPRAPSSERSSAKSGDSGDDPEQPPVRGQQLQLFPAPRIGGRR